MRGVCLPAKRRRGALWRLWLAPTNLMGRVVALFLGCEDQGSVGGEMSPARLFFFPGERYRGLGAIALGHVILAERTFLSGDRGSWVLAHELSHTRQHDILGPFYLPLHGVAQLLSCLISLLRPVRGYPPMHAYNPLERSFLCVPFDELVEGGELGAEEKVVLRAFDLEGWRFE